MIKGCQQFLKAPLHLGSCGICNFVSLLHLAKKCYLYLFCQCCCRACSAASSNYFCSEHSWCPLAYKSGSVPWCTLMQAQSNIVTARSSCYAVPFLHVLPSIIISGIYISKVLKSVLQINNELSLLKLDGLALGSQLSRVCNILAVYLRR